MGNRPNECSAPSDLPDKAQTGILSCAKTQRPSILLTPSRTFCSYSSLRSRHIFAASTFAGLSSLGSASMLMTDMRIFSTLCMGDHRSDACS